MHIYQKKDIDSPIVTDHGEIIYELIGRAVGDTTDKHSVAYVIIPPNKSSLLHYHPEAEESYFVLKGKAQMMLGDEESLVESGQAILIPSDKRHKIVNVGEEDLELLAICVPAWEPTNTVYPETELDDDKTTLHKVAGLKRENLIQSALEAKLNAISGYDTIIWKIRAGYVLIVNGALTLILSTVGRPNLETVTRDLGLALSVFFLILGFSISIAIVDIGYVTKKLRVIVSRDLLSDIAPTRKEPGKLLHITGEIPMKLISDSAAQLFRTKMRRNFYGIILPLYGTAPAIAVIIYLVSTLVR